MAARTYMHLYVTYEFHLKKIFKKIINIIKLLN